MVEPTSSLRIFVVGAGIGGLAAAVALRRQGHHVEVFESSLMNREIGAAITVQANAMKVLDFLGYEVANLKGVDFLGTVRFDATGGEGITREFNYENLGRAGWHCLRSDLHDELKRLALSTDGAGRPVILHLGREVVSCNADEGSVVLRSGEIQQADLIVGADGIHSVVRTAVLGYEQKALATGLSTFRCLFDADKLKSLDDMDWYTQGLSGGRAVLAPGERFRLLFLIPCRHGKVVNVAAHHVDDRNQDQHEWSEKATMDDVLTEFSGFHPRYLKFLEQGQQPILRWQLRALPVLPTWIRGKALLLGDAAHATLPTIGQGAGMALEDAATIALLLPQGSKVADIPERLKAYQELRKPRGEFVNRESLEQATMPSRRGFYERSREQQLFLIGFDVIESTKKYYQDNFF
ncbi:FAD/NAD(P)-binding domain-containing protein [Mycena indigotica]|uniref:FAD/NAD(P)-binding domain-containing protein n=1 Tax=Mycena indigotica TaxID=2126181 RepID=A0A8H6VT65_9AGAR|nr:FAD/NAD(P)-binding domain-containing protein [Mycena indigotica]KAF7293057.1 FAD/NAD(P)-binding domain-containing protein [Mycena indigotica]